VSTQRSQGPSRRLAAVSSSILILVGCTPGASQSATSSTTAEPSGSQASASAATVTPAASPSASQAPALGFLPPDSRARALVDGLRIRQEASTTADVVATLTMGDVVYINASVDVWGPVLSEGIAWYPVVFENRLGGWVAGERGEER
jgi:hypothetical protein